MTEQHTAPDQYIEQHQSPDTVTSSETQPPAPVVDKSFVTNKFDVIVPVAEPHIYADAGGKHLFVYGGSPQNKMIAVMEYLTKHPDKIVFSSDNNDTVRIPWRLVNGELAVAGNPVQTSGFFGFFKSFMKAPAPDEFAKIIK